MKEKSFWNNAWVVNTGSALLAYFVPVLFGYFFKEGTFLYWLIFPVVWIWNFITQSVSLQLYWIIIISLLSTFIIPVIRAIRTPAISNVNPPTNLEPWLSYTKETFGDVVYRWRYIKLDDNKIDIQNVVPFCPTDDCELMEPSYSIIPSYCPICKNTFNVLSSDEARIRIRHAANGRIKVKTRLSQNWAN